MTTALHTKYRPQDLDSVIGHEDAVAKLKGMISKEKWPSAIGLFGPTSVGKTTLARALVRSATGKNPLGNPDYTEVNLSDDRSIESVRSLIQQSRLRPVNGSRRFILLDEAQGILGNAPAANALLMGLENPPASTTWIVCSMSPEAFRSSVTGRALANRCLSIRLKAPSAESVSEFVSRILKGEKATKYVTPEGIASIVEHAGSEMRTAAHLVQSVIAHYEGQGSNKPLGPKDIPTVLSGSVDNDEFLSVRFLMAIYARKAKTAHKTLLQVSDYFGFINKLLWASWACVNEKMVGDSGGQAVFGASRSAVNAMGELELDWRVVAAVHDLVVDLKAKSTSFAVPEQMALFQFYTRAIQRAEEVS